MIGLPLTAEQQARRDYWARVHVEGDRNKPVTYPLARAARRLLGTGTRIERGRTVEP